MLPEIQPFIQPFYFLVIITSFVVILSLISAWRRAIKLSIALAILSQILPLILLPVVSIGIFGDGFLILDNLAKYGALIILLSAFLVLILFVGYFSKFEWLPYLNNAVVLSVFGAMILIMASDFIVFYIGWVAMSLPLYAMISISKEKLRSLEAAVKFFVMDAMDSILLVFGIALLFGMTQSTVFSEIKISLTTQNTNPYILLATVFIVAAFSIKFALIPFHMYLPDLADGAAPVVTAFIISAEKAATYIGLIRLATLVLYPLRDFLFIILSGLAVISIIIGNIMALNQRNLLRLFAYSSIAHSGYIIAGVSLFTVYGFAAALFHVLTVSLSDILVFGSLAIFSGTFNIRTLDEINGAGRLIPSASAGLTFGLLSLLGFPPLAAFWSKLLILFAVWDAGVLWLAVIVIIGIAISVGYYARVFKHIWIDAPIKEIKAKPIHDAYYIAILSLILLIIGIGLMPYLFFGLASLAVPILS